MAARVCSECGGSLEGKAPSAKTCSVQCRQKRARRRKAANDNIEAQQAEVAVAQVVAREHDTVIERVLQQELEPVVRAAIDDEVLRAVDKLVKLTPLAISVLEEDLASDDAVLRQRAANTLVKYTIGHPALLKPQDEKHEQLIVNFNLPRPDDDPASGQDEVLRDVEEVEEDRVCDMCGELKPLPEFVAGSDRCKTCFEEYKANILRSIQ